MFTCIYCQKNDPEVTPSDAHLFPMAMGGVMFANNTVCEGCNGLVNREVEMPAINSFAFFQSVWGIKGRRRKRKGVSAIARFGDDQKWTYLNEVGEPASEIVFVEPTADGKKAYRVFGSPEQSKQTREQLSRKHPNIRWTEMPPTSNQLLQIAVPLAKDLGCQTIRRLAAKIAFERFAQIRSSQFLQDTQYNTTRDFVLTGNEVTCCCGVLGDSQLLNGILDFDLPNHAVLLIAHPSSRMLGAFVTFYGLFSFWIHLSTKYVALAPFDDLLVQNPQSGVVWTPMLRLGTGSLVVSWSRIAEKYRNDPEGVEILAISYASEKFHKAADEFYGIDEPAV